MPSETERKNSATICVWNADGASFVAADRPIGERSSSATVKTNRIPMIASSGVEFAAPPANGRNSRNAAPMMIAPSANFTGVDGWRAPSFVQIAANTPDSTMMKTGLIDCTHETGISQPNRSRFRRSSEYTVSTVNCCWYSDQNATLVMNSGRKPHTRDRSVALMRRLVRITAK